MAAHEILRPEHCARLVLRENPPHAYFGKGVAVPTKTHTTAVPVRFAPRHICRGSETFRATLRRLLRRGRSTPRSVCIHSLVNGGPSIEAYKREIAQNPASQTLDPLRALLAVVGNDGGLIQIWQTYVHHICHRLYLHQVLWCADRL